MIAVRVLAIVSTTLRRIAWILRTPALAVASLAGVAAAAIFVVAPIAITSDASSAGVPSGAPTSPRRDAPMSTPAPPTGGGFTLLNPSVDGQALRWSCETIRVFYDPAGEPYAAASDVAAATAMLAEGFGPGRVLYAGTTTRTPDSIEGNPPSHPIVVVGWVPTAAALPDPSDPFTIGEGGPVTEGNRIVAGTVWLVANGGLAPGLGAHSWGAALTHEFGHAVGNLGHVQDPTSAMTPAISATRPAGWGRGDLNGLHGAAGICPSH